MIAAGLATMLLIGVLASAWFVREGSLTTRLAYALLLGVGSIPLATVPLALALEIHVTPGLAAGGAATLLGLLALLHGLARGRHLRPPPVTAADGILLGLAAAVALGAHLHHDDSELLTSVAAYLRTGEARCFYMQTFQLVPGLNPDAARPDAGAFFQVINTPGNALFTAGWMPLFGAHTFHVLYVAFTVLAFLFTALLLRRVTGRFPVAAAGALFAVAGPHALGIEVLDRNVIACVLLTALLHAVLLQPRRYVLHGLLFGVAAGAGLRCLPLVFAAPLLALYVSHRTPVRGYLLLGGATALGFAINLPHLVHHGLHSLGETEPLWQLAWLAVAGPARTPLLPYPNGVLYPLDWLRDVGLGIAALVLLGVPAAWRRDRTLTLALLWWLLVPLAVLACQRDWLEGEKLRIVAMSTTAWIALGALGADLVLRRSRLPARIGAYGGAVALTLALALGASLIHGRPDPGTYDRRPVYQHESTDFLALHRRALRPVNPLPDYRRLFLKLDPGRKARASRILRDDLFGTQRRELPWVQRWLPVTGGTDPAATSGGASLVELSVDLEKLVTDPGSAATIGGTGGRPFVDLEDGEGLLDVYHKQVQVSWQPEPLPVVVFPRQSTVAGLDELTVELNAFHSFGPDEIGFERIHQIDLWVREEERPRGHRTGMTALPQTDDEPRIVLRVPATTHVIVRGWLIDGAQGAPHRVDSWSIRIGKDGQPRVRFQPFEPESYL